MKITITISNVQHIVKQTVQFNLSEHKLTCIAGKNGVGKTTLIRAIRNLAVNSTFQETAAPYIFNETSNINYSIEGLEQDIEFTYNKFLKSIDSKQHISEELKQKINVELPIPHGERFNHFRRLSDIDEELRTKIAIGDFVRPDNLIDFLQKIYGKNKFSKLKQVEIRNTFYYFILKDEDERYYIREDYFSSGEYFVVNLFKQIQQGKKIIVIDEIDISLDASAQVNLVDALRACCDEYKTNIVFTTHSLALMKTLKNNELYYMECEGDNISLVPRSYNFIKSIMYGFAGSDRYILTEDECLAKYIEYLLKVDNVELFYQYNIIYIGGATQVIDLMERNSKQNFLSENENTLAVLDGDQEGKRYIKGLENVLLLPFINIEVKLFQMFEANEFIVDGLEPIVNKKYSDKAKNLYKQLTKSRLNGALMPEVEIYKLLEKVNPKGVNRFKMQLIEFLSAKKGV